FSPHTPRSHDTHQAALGVSAASSSPRSTRSPSHFAIAAVARVLPITLVAERPISRNWSMPMISSNPASGMLKLASVAAMTTSEARGTPPSGVRDGVAELIRVNPGLEKIVMITEKISVHDAREIRALGQANGIDIFGANCLGVADSWNRVRIGGALGGDNP